MIRFKKDDGSDYPDWRNNILLEDISEFITKGATPTTYGYKWVDKGIPFFRNDSIKNNYFVYGEYSYISDEADKFLSRSQIKADDLLITITGEIGNIGIVPKTIKHGNINQHISRIRIKKEHMPYYVYQYLCSPNIQRFYNKIRTGQTMPQLGLGQIRKFKIPIPCLEEQQKIADFLSSVDEVIEASEKEVEQLELQKKGAMQKIFNQEVRFKDDEGNEYPEWKQHTLEDILCFQYGKYNTNPDNGGIYPIYGANGIIGGFNEYNAEDSIVIGHIGTAGTVLWGKGKHFVTYNGTITTPKNKDELLSLFGYYLLISLNIPQICNGSSQPFLSYDKLNKINCKTPCSKEQHKIADFLSSMDETIEYAKKELEGWKQLKKGLLQQMFI